ECDTGGRRCGVRTPEAAMELARTIAACPGLTFGGLMTFPAIAGQRRVTDFMHDARAEIEALGIRCAEVSSGGSPDMWRAETGGVL
ncbi:MAG: alanine racemase, partial [Rhodobacteraceae bacterium]|nr:alanine racemase [Paracoccaceae bacterium]